MSASLLLQLPPGVASVKVIVDPPQTTNDGPLIATGAALTVTTKLAGQLP
jgi:hypothetical protein